MSLINFVWLTREHFIGADWRESFYSRVVSTHVCIFLFKFTLLYNQVLLYIINVWILTLIPHFCYVYI